MPPIAAAGGADQVIGPEEQEHLVLEALASSAPSMRRVLVIPPDITRLNSGAGDLTAMLWRHLAGTAEVDILPAIGTHAPMTDNEIRRMFGPDIPRERFHVHEWRKALDHRGDVPAELVREWSEGKIDYPVPIEVNERLTSGGYDLILSIGQIVPHEVVGMANYTKNICVGVGGRETINKSHFLGAAHGMERIMGRVDSPPRRVFNYGCREFLADLPILYVLTVMERDPESDTMAMRGLFVGRDDETFAAGCRLSQQVNVTLLDRAPRKVVVYLDPEEFKSTWLGNKAVYRTRMAIADDGELIVLAPGLREFGEDRDIDRLIRRFGYRTTPEILANVDKYPELGDNLSAAAHLIHGSSEGRFRITYCPGPAMDLQTIRDVGYQAASLDEMLERYPPHQLREGWNDWHGEEVFFIGNPALGLWARRDRFVADR